MMVPLSEEDFENGPDVLRPSFIGKSKKASIRSNSPGAMWPGPSSRKFGAIQSQNLNDGLGQGNKIAIFPDAIAGAAALFDLWDRVYANMRLRDAIKRWSGGNHVQSYLDVIWDQAQIPPDMIITREMLRNPDFGIKLAKAMAWHEAGEHFPLTDEHWRQAHAEAFLLPPPVALPTRTEAKAVLKQQSSKYSVSGWFKNAMAFFGIGVPATWQGLKANVDASNDIVMTVGSLLSQYGIVAFSGVCIAAAIAFNWLQNRQIDDVQAGRATPSGAEE